MGTNWTWEQCVRDISCSADPGKCGSLATRWKSIAESLLQVARYLSEETAGATPAEGTATATDGGRSLTGMLADWSGAGGAAYRQRAADLARDAQNLSADATQIGNALSRLADDIAKATESIPIPVRDRWGSLAFASRSTVMYLPGNTRVNTSSLSDTSLRRALAADYQKTPDAYADGAFMHMAEKTITTLQKQSGTWSPAAVNQATADLAAWYTACTTAAVTGAAPLPPAVVDEGPSFTVTTGAPVVDTSTPTTLTSTPYADTTSTTGLAGAGRMAMSGLDGGGGGLGGLGGLGANGVLGGVGATETGRGGLPGLLSPGGRGIAPLTSPAAVLQSTPGQSSGGMMGMAAPMGGGVAGSGGSNSRNSQEDWLYEPAMWNVDAEVCPAVIDAGDVVSDDDDDEDEDD